MIWTINFIFSLIQSIICISVCQRNVRLWLTPPPLPLSANVRIWFTPLPPKVADVINERPLREPNIVAPYSYIQKGTTYCGSLLTYSTCGSLLLIPLLKSSCFFFAGVSGSRLAWLLSGSSHVWFCINLGNKAHKVMAAAGQPWSSQLWDNLVGGLSRDNEKTSSSGSW